MGQELVFEELVAKVTKLEFFNFIYGTIENEMLQDARCFNRYEEMVTDHQTAMGSGPVVLSYVSAGCNLTPRTLDWLGSHNLIAYGSHSSVHIYKPEDSESNGGKVIQTLCGHKNRVNAVRWLNTLGESRAVVPEIATASSDSMVRVWSLVDGEFANTSIIKGHDGAVTDLTGLFMSESNALAIVASAGTDFSIKLWKRNALGDNFSLLDSINLKSSLCVALEVSALPGLERDVALLAISTENLGIQLYSVSIRSAGTNSTTKLATLTGHEDWVRGLSFTPFIDSTDMFLASSSQDTTVRIWKFSRTVGPLEETADANDPDEFRMEKKSFCLDNQTFSVTLETVLIGHEGWVYASKWVPSTTKAADLQLMTFSFDHTIILWSPDPGSGGVWLERARLGNVGGEALGFLGGAIGPDGRSVVAHSHQGSLSLWQLVTSEAEEGRWCPRPICGGHFGEVTDIAWEKNGHYLLSVSADQTTRLHAQWTTSNASEKNWYELARPQIHGYSMNSIATLPDFKFVSAADEKVARAFAAPFNTLENLRLLSGVEIPSEAFGNSSEPVGATVPALGLSNKAVYTERSDGVESKNDIVSFSRQYLNEPPTDDFLSQNSLWPEIMKLYGHGYDVYSVAASNKGRYVATACKATSSEHARLILWNTSNWEKEQHFEGSGHTLTVTQMCFSPDDRFLLSVSRDRNWAVHVAQEAGDSVSPYRLLASSDKKTGVHLRIIWSCCWSSDSRLFATASREGVCAVWSAERLASAAGVGQSSEGVAIATKDWLADQPKTFEEPVTAVEFSPGTIQSNDSRSARLLAVGTDSGRVHLCSFEIGADEPWSILHTIENLHSSTISQLSFRPKSSEDGKLTLASSSHDHSVKLFTIRPSLFVNSG
ncbi:Elongator complex protein [Nesidiocoris tenuis]|uniref:Elongator complex protein 2 n=1 Tax=Nesidiocoris tenuis TaxID=355587 RepID=A0ABN7BG25_9HEMI|nr:Elongator complex protein [Nesidiocoris tenuis]